MLDFLKTLFGSRPQPPPAATSRTTGVTQPTVVAPEQPTKTVYLADERQFETAEAAQAYLDTKKRERKREARKRAVKPIDEAAIVDVSTSTRAFNVALVGESYRQAALRRISAGRRARGEEVCFRAVLTAEPDNPYDPNAIRVDAEGVGQVGYLSAEDAVAYKAAFDMLSAVQRSAVCGAKLVGGTAGKPSLGAVISLVDPDELIARIRFVADPQPF